MTPSPVIGAKPSPPLARNVCLGRGCGCAGARAVVAPAILRSIKTVAAAPGAARVRSSSSRRARSARSLALAAREREKRRSRSSSFSGVREGW